MGLGGSKNFAALMALAFFTIAVCNLNAFQVVVKSSNLVVTPGAYSWITSQYAYPIEMNIESVTHSLTVSPQGNIIDPNPAATKLIITWGWGDNSATKTTLGSDSWLTHTYAHAGIYTVTIKVVDNLGIANTYSQIITVPSSRVYTQVSNTVTAGNATWAPTVIGFTGQPLYVIGIGQPLLSLGYTPYGSKMLLYYAPFNNTFEQSVILTFAPTANSVTIPQSYLTKPGLYRVSGPIVVNNITINQTTQWIALYDQNDLPPALRQTFSNATLLSLMATSNYTELLNKTNALNRSIIAMQQRLASANSTIASLLNKTGGRIFPIIGLVSNADVIVLIICLILLILLILIYLRGRDRDERYSWEDRDDRWDNSSESFFKKAGGNTKNQQSIDGGEDGYNQRGEIENSPSEGDSSRGSYSYDSKGTDLDKPANIETENESLDSTEQDGIDKSSQSEDYKDGEVSDQNTEESSPEIEESNKSSDSQSSTDENLGNSEADLSKEDISQEVENENPEEEGGKEAENDQNLGEGETDTENEGILGGIGKKLSQGFSTRRKSKGAGKGKKKDESE